MIELNDESSTNTPEQAVEHLKKYIDKISKRYTKHYGKAVLTDDLFL